VEVYTTNGEMRNKRYEGRSLIGEGAHHSNQSEVSRGGLSDTTVVSQKGPLDRNISAPVSIEATMSYRWSERYTEVTDPRENS
jgi:hypothetical protein